MQKVGFGSLPKELELLLPSIQKPSAQHRQLTTANKCLILLLDYSFCATFPKKQLFYNG